MIRGSKTGKLNLRIYFFDFENPVINFNKRHCYQVRLIIIIIREDVKINTKEKTIIIYHFSVITSGVSNSM
jgi:uncharacterized membrane protein